VSAGLASKSSTFGPHIIYVLCMDLTTKSDSFLQH